MRTFGTLNSSRITSSSVCYLTNAVVVLLITFIVPMFRLLYHSLRLWAISTGLFQDERHGQLLTISPPPIGCFTSELLRELAWNIFVEHGDGDCCKAEDMSQMVGAYFITHNGCLQSTIRARCAFYSDSNGPFARIWSTSQFRTVHEEFRKFINSLNALRVSRGPKDTVTNDFHKILQDLLAQPISQKFHSEWYVQATMQYSGQSQQDGTKMMEFVESEFCSLAHGMLSHKQTLFNCQLALCHFCSAAVDSI